MISPTGYWTGAMVLKHQRSVALENWLVRFLDGRQGEPVYDLGCGFGYYLAALQRAGFGKLAGFEGEVSPLRVFMNIFPQDLTEPFKVPKPGVVLFLEVGEHVPAEYEGQLLQNVSDACSDLLIASWALPGQGGDGHVNELPHDVVIPKMNRFGFKLDPDATHEARALDFGHTWWFRHSMLVFRR